MSFNSTVVCSIHSAKSNLLCLFPGCSSRVLCSECFKDHDISHLNSIIALNPNFHLTPHSFLNNLANLEKEVSLIKEKIKLQKDEQHREMEVFFSYLETNFLRNLELFKKKAFKLFFDFHLFYENNVLNCLTKIRKEIIEIQKLLDHDKKYFSNERIHLILEKQKEWDQIIIPNLNEEKERILKENKEKKVKINSNKLLTEFESYVKLIFLPETLLKCGPLIFRREDEGNLKNLNLLDESRNMSFVANFDSQNKIMLEGLPKIKQINDYKQLKYKFIKIGSHSDSITSIAFDFDLQILFSASKDKMIKSWDLKNSLFLNEFKAHEKAISKIYFIPPNVNNIHQCLVSFGEDFCMKIWNSKTLECLKILNNMNQIVYDCLYIEDGNVFLTTGSDGNLKLWNLEGGKLLKSINIHDLAVKCLLFVPKYTLLLTAGSDAKIKLWDFNLLKLKAEYLGHQVEITCIDYSPKLNSLVSSSKDSTIKFWVLFEKGFKFSIKAHDKGVFFVKFLDSEENFVSGGGDGLIKIWRINGDIVITLQGHQENINCLLQIKAKLFLTGGWDHKIMAWKIMKNK